MFYRLRPATGHADGFLRKSATVATGQMVSYGLALAASPILSRLYRPEDFGLMAIFATIVSVLAAIATLRYDQALVLPKDDASAAALATIAKWAAILSTGGLLLAAAVFGDAISRTVFRSREAPFSFLVAAAVAGLASCEIHNAWLLRHGKFVQLSRMRVCQVVTCLATQIAVPFVWISGSLGLLIGPIAGYLAENVLFHLAGGHGKTGSRLIAVRDVRRVAVEYRNYPLFDIWSSLARILTVNCPALLIAWLYGPASAGCLVLAQRLLSTPLSMLSYSVSRVYYSEAAALARDSPSDLPGLFAVTLKRLTMLAAPPLAVVCAIAPWTFDVIFGSRWRPAGVCCSLLCPLILLRVIAFVVGPTLDVVHRQGLRLLRELCCLLLIAAGVVGARWLGGSELAAVAAMSVLGSAGYAIAVLIAWLAVLDFSTSSEVQPALQTGGQAA